MALTEEQNGKHSFDAIAEYACQTFQLGKLEQVVRKLSGSYNTTVLIATEHGRYVVRLLNAAGQISHLKEIQHLLIQLHQAAVPVPVPITTLQGDCYAEWEGSLIQVTPFVEGAGFNCRKEQVYQSGIMLRRFHDVLQASRHEVSPKPTKSFYKPNSYFIDALSLMKMNTQLPKHEIELVESFMESMLEQWGRYEHKMTRSFIHGDWHLWNQIYLPSDHEEPAEADHVIGVMDFDYLEEGYRIFDVAYALWSIYVLLPKYASSFDNSFMSGYGMIREEEKQALSAVIARISLFFLSNSAISEQSSKWAAQCKRQFPLLKWLNADGQERLSKIVLSGS